MDEIVHYALSSGDGSRAIDRRTFLWIALAAIALSVLTLPSCQVGITSATTDAASPGTPGPSPTPTITLALLGDVMLGRDVHPTHQTFTYLEPFLTSADLALANLESPLTDSPVQTESPYALCALPENVSYLADAGFDYLSLANNHRLDCGTEGLLETKLTLTEAGLGFVGPDPVYRSIDAIHLAFLAFDATGQFDVEAAVQAVQSAREAGNLVVVSMHWGVEYQSGASTDQQQIASRLAGAGAALIWGHHPHVLQTSEWLHDGKTLALYSLGNALFDQYGLRATRRSALVLATLDSSGVEEFKAIPFLIDIQNSRIVQAGQNDAQLILNYFE